MEGVAADGSQIGTYSEGYMKTRTGAGFKSSRVARGERKGQKRKLYNRTADTKVIASLTREMENDYAVIPLTNGYAVGFHSDLSFNKSKWVEKTYNKSIFYPTSDELQELTDYAQTEATRLINGQ